MRIGKIILLAALVLLLASGCMPEGITSPLTTTVEHKTTLRICWWGSQTRHDKTLAVLDLYTKKNNVTFDPDFSAFDGYFEKLNILIAASDAPDLIQMGGNFVNYIGQIEDLAPYIQSGIINVDDTGESFLATTTLEGKVAGISSGTNAQGIAYDPALFAKAGVPEPAVNWTWDDYEAAALQIHERLDIFGSSKLEEINALIIAVDQYDSGQTFFVYPYRRALNYTDDRYVEAFLAMKKRLTLAGAYPNPAQLAAIHDIEGDYLVKGEAAMAWIYTNQFVAMSKAANRTLKIITPPRRTSTGPLAMSIASSQMFVINKDSSIKEEAARWINYFVNDLEANALLGGERGIPVMKKVRDMLAEQLTDAEKTIYNYLDTVGQEASLDVVLDAPRQTEIKNLYTKLSEEVVFGKKTAATAAAELREGAAAILARD